jgi:TolA-binding protein
LARPPRRRRGRWSWDAMAGVTLLSSVAFAWWAGGMRLREPGLDRAGDPSTHPPPIAHLGAASTAPREPAEEHAKEDLLDRVPEAPSPRPALDERARPSAVEHVEPASPRASAHARKAHGGVHGAATSEAVAVLDTDAARDWFRKANAARRDGDLASASALYTGLQSKFPTSDEARLSHVSLGKLLLSSGKAADAERQFSLYIAAGGGELAEEALVGRAESLHRLGRTAEERKTWQSLLRDSPAGIYAARAKQRLEDLDSGDLPSR